jgi:hypothetical protein
VLASGTPTRIPLAPNAWFQLDDAAGTETVYVIASRDPLSTVDGMLDEEIRAIRDAGGAPTPAVQPVPVVAKQPVSDSAAGTSKPPPRARRPERMLTMANRGLHEVVEIAGRSVVDTMVPVNDDGVVVAWFSFRHER